LPHTCKARSIGSESGWTMRSPAIEFFKEHRRCELFPRARLTGYTRGPCPDGYVSMASDDPASAQSAAKPVTTSSGLQTIDTKVGTGASPRSGQTVTRALHRLAL